MRAAERSDSLAQALAARFKLPGLSGADHGVAVAILANTEATFGEAEAVAFARLALPNR